MNVNGRHMSKFARFDPKNIISDFKIHKDGVILRLDDKENIEWWLEVDIPKEVMENLLQEVKLAAVPNGEEEVEGF